jgi:hypothetical protein
MITLIALKLTGVVAWSWWWIFSPAWLGGAVLALLPGILVILWCLGRWPVILVDLFRWRGRRQSRFFPRFEEMDAAPDAPWREPGAPE